MTDDAKRSIRQSTLGADRGLRVIDGGGGSEPPEQPQDGGDGCPVTALGHLDGDFVFLDVRGQRRTLSARALGRRDDMLALFGGDDAWLRQHYPRTINVNARRKGAEPVWEVIDFDLMDAAPALQRACFAAGLFGDSTKIRQPGVWRGEDALPVVHCGDKVLIGDRWHPAGARVGRQIFAAAEPTARPGAPCPAAIGQDIQAGLAQWWGFREGGGPIAVMGLVANAYYGAAIDWRPAGFVAGDTGWGKSRLQDVMRGCLPLHHYDNDTSKAGIEQAVHGRAMPIIIDEATDRANRSAARDLVDLVLSSVGGEGTKGSRGTVDGRGRKIELAGLIVMFSINAPDLEPQHLGRFTLIDLRAPEDGADHKDQQIAVAALARKHGPALWGRALAGFERYRTSLDRFRAGLRARKCAPREMDQLGGLLAGWWVLVREGVPDDRGVREGVAALDGFVRGAGDVAADGRPRRMLLHLLSSLVALHRSTEREPVGKLLEIAFGEHGSLRVPEDAVELLGYYGIRVVRACLYRGAPKPLDDRGCPCPQCRINGKPVPRLSDEAGAWFANQHPELRKLFVGTPYDDGRWRQEMLRLEGARESRGTVRVGSAPGRAVWLPRANMAAPDIPETE